MRSLLATVILLLAASNVALAADTSAFVELCSSADLTSAQAHTMRVVVRDLIDRERVAPELKRSTCEKAAEELDQRTGLFLVNEGLVDLSPLATMPRLEFLHLSHNGIVDVAPLASLQHLRVLDLADNRIKDARPLNGLSTLESLELKDNPIEFATAPRPAPAPKVVFAESSPRVVERVHHVGYYHHDHYRFGHRHHHRHHDYHYGHGHHHRPDWLYTWLGLAVIFSLAH